MMRHLLLIAIIIIINSISYNNLISSEIILTEINKYDEIRKRKEEKLLFSMYPKTIPHYPVRLDKYNNHVSRGRYELLSSSSSSSSSSSKTLNNKVSLHKFKEILQCSINEPSLDEYYGTLSLLLLFPPTKESIELLCTWGETNCPNWVDCKLRRDDIKKNNNYNNNSLNILSNLKQFRMLRITNNKLYFDWPWGSHRAKYSNFDIWNTAILVKILESVNDIGDSVFFIGGETPSLPFTFPFPQINQAGSYSANGGTNTIVWPWEVEYKIAYGYHKEIISNYNSNFSDINFQKITGTLMCS
jgi:hypothetical protein